jgi:hypothetical protein
MIGWGQRQAVHPPIAIAPIQPIALAAVASRAHCLVGAQRAGRSERLHVKAEIRQLLRCLGVRPAARAADALSSRPSSPVRSLALTNVAIVAVSVRSSAISAWQSSVVAALARP